MCIANRLSEARPTFDAVAKSGAGLGSCQSAGSRGQYYHCDMIHVTWHRCRMDRFECLLTAPEIRAVSVSRGGRVRILSNYGCPGPKVPGFKLKLELMDNLNGSLDPALFKFHPASAFGV